jgi:hypothetical protein
MRLKFHPLALVTASLLICGCSASRTWSPLRQATPGFSKYGPTAHPAQPSVNYEADPPVETPPDRIAKEPPMAPPAFGASHTKQISFAGDLSDKLKSSFRSVHHSKSGAGCTSTGSCTDADGCNNCDGACGSTDGCGAANGCCGTEGCRETAVRTRKPLLKSFLQRFSFKGERCSQSCADPACCAEGSTTDHGCSVPRVEAPCAEAPCAEGCGLIAPDCYHLQRGNGSSCLAERLEDPFLDYPAPNEHSQHNAAEADNATPQEATPLTAPPPAPEPVEPQQIGVSFQSHSNAQLIQPPQWPRRNTMTFGGSVSTGLTIRPTAQLPRR